MVAFVMALIGNVIGTSAALIGYFLLQTPLVTALAIWLCGGLAVTVLGLILVLVAQRAPSARTPAHRIAMSDAAMSDAAMSDANCGRAPI